MRAKVILDSPAVAVLPSVGVRRHRLFLTERPSVRSIPNAQLQVAPRVVGPPAYDGRCDDSSGLLPSLLSAAVLVLMCLSVLLV